MRRKPLAAAEVLAVARAAVAQEAVAQEAVRAAVLLEAARVAGAVQVADLQEGPATVVARGEEVPARELAGERQARVDTGARAETEVQRRPEAEAATAELAVGAVAAELEAGVDRQELRGCLVRPARTPPGGGPVPLGDQIQIPSRQCAGTPKHADCLKARS